MREDAIVGLPPPLSTRAEPDPRAAASVHSERDAMAWPPGAWERDPGAWRDDLATGPDAFEPYDPARETGSPSADVEPEAETEEASRSYLREIAETAVMVVLIFLGIKLVVQNFKIEGASMMPTLESGQYVLVNRLAYRIFGEPERGDVIVFHAWDQAGEKDFIKRVIGLPGDELEIRDGRLVINGSELDEPYLDALSTQPSLGPITLAEDEFYVLGDNRNNSSDSRNYGVLDGERMVGRAWLTYWPPGEIHVIDNGQGAYAEDGT